MAATSAVLEAEGASANAGRHTPPTGKLDRDDAVEVSAESVKHFTSGNDTAATGENPAQSNELAVPGGDDRMTPAEQNELDEHVQKIEKAYERQGRADLDGLKELRQIHRKRLYRAFGSFEKFVEAKLPKRTRQWAYNKLTQITVLENLGIDYISEEKAKLLENYDPDVQRDIAKQAGKRSWASGNALPLATEPLSRQRLTRRTRLPRPRRNRKRNPRPTRSL